MPELFVTVTDTAFDDCGEEFSKEVPAAVVSDKDLCELIAQGLLHDHGYLCGVEYEWRIVRADLATP